MDIYEYFKSLMLGMRRQVEMTMKDVTSEEFNWAPSGTANTISATFIHMTSVEDHFVQTFLQGKPRIWDEDGWGEKTGVKKTPNIGENWDEFKKTTVAIAPLMTYQKAVWAATDAYLAQLTQEELDRKVKFAGGERSVADMLLLAASQELSHSGEIAALKGIQGYKGLPI